MSNLSVFNFQNNSIRVVSNENNNPLFVASDVAEALGYAEPSRAVRQHCKGRAKHTPLQTAGGKQNIRVIYEPDVYRLIFGSKLESAIKFQDWVFEEVLPALRKTGKYEITRKTITPEQQRHIQELVNKIQHEQGVHWQSTYHNLKTRFQVGSYKDIKEEDYPAACYYLGGAPLEGEYIPHGQPALTVLPPFELSQRPNLGKIPFDQNNPYPADGRTSAMCASIINDFVNWSLKLPEGSPRDDFREALAMLQELMVTGWTEVDEALSAFSRGVHYLKRWQGRGGMVGNMR